jgi:hypothetical protein
MSIQKIPLETLQKIRQHIQTALTLPDSENHPKPRALQSQEEPPEPDSLSDLGNLFNFGGLLDETTYAPNDQGQWFITTSDPGAALLKLPGLQLKPGHRLVSYLYRKAEDGVGVTWALPEALSTTAHLEQALRNLCDLTHPPHPQGALTDVMEAIQGDRSAISFVVASMLQRELKELGALGKSCDWFHHRLVSAPPAQATWHWRVENLPKDLTPKVRVLDNGKAAIEFFSCRVIPPIALFQHVDQYPVDSYKPARVDRAIAVARRG